MLGVGAADDNGGSDSGELTEPGEDDKVESIQSILSWFDEQGYSLPGSGTGNGPETANISANPTANVTDTTVAAAAAAAAASRPSPIPEEEDLVETRDFLQVEGKAQLGANGGNSLLQHADDAVESASLSGRSTEAASGSFAAAGAPGAAASSALEPLLEISSDSRSVPHRALPAFLDPPDFLELEDPAAISQWERPRPRPPPVPLVRGKAAAAGGGGSGGSSGSSGSGGSGGQPPPQEPPVPLRAMEVLIRPDVPWQAVVEVFEGVMLSGGLLVRQRQDNKDTSSSDAAAAPAAADANVVVAERPPGAGVAGDWRTVSLRGGVTPAKLRVALVRFYSDAASGGPILNLGVPQRKLPRRGGDELLAALAAALEERRLPLRHLATEAKEATLDPAYVKDLIDMYAYENTANLAEYAVPLERFIRVEELRSAELVATLLPAYRAAAAAAPAAASGTMAASGKEGLAVPRPRRGKPLSAYPLELPRGSLAACGFAEARQLIEEARGSAFLGAPEAAAAAAAAHNGETAPAAAARGVRRLIRLVWREISEWCAEEAKARIRRKDMQVRDRLRAVEEYRATVVATLRDSSAARNSAPAREFASRFRVMAEEVPLAACPAAHGNRPGRLYVTAVHVAFHGGLLGFAWQKVLPLLSLSSARIIPGGGGLSLPLGLGSDALALEDAGGAEHIFAVTGVEPRQAVRMLDLVQQVMAMAKAAAKLRAAAETAVTTEEEAGIQAAANGNAGYPAGTSGTTAVASKASGAAAAAAAAAGVAPAIVATGSNGGLKSGGGEAGEGEEDEMAILARVKREARLRYEKAAEEAAAADARAHASAGDAVGGATDGDAGGGGGAATAERAESATAAAAAQAATAATAAAAADAAARGRQRDVPAAATPAGAAPLPLPSPPGRSPGQGKRRSAMAQGIQAFLEQSRSRNPSL